MWRVIVDAVDCYLKDLPVSEQLLVQTLLLSPATTRKRRR
jgi:hypothetical protein